MNYSTGDEFTGTANWTKHTREGHVRASGTFQIVDVKTGKISKSKSITAEYESRAQWVTYTGMEKALDPIVLQHHTTGDTPIAPPEELVQKTIQYLGQQIAKQIVAQYD